MRGGRDDFRTRARLCSRKDDTEDVINCTSKDVRGGRLLTSSFALISLQREWAVLTGRHYLDATEQKGNKVIVPSDGRVLSPLIRARGKACTIRQAAQGRGWGSSADEFYVKQQTKANDKRCSFGE